MEKLKSIVFVAGVLLLILAAAMGCLSIKYLFAILPADSYEDKGFYTFSPYQVLLVQVQNTGVSGCGRRMNPTKTAESYTAGLRQKYITVLVLAGAYVLLYVIAWCMIGSMKRRMRQI